ncbi:hypothetical protein OUZ56_025034 [Daphnia magna]|uniref:Uncharacterized protein n=1 Tax=Daphnia magna TaxID=35525 RepID=A0ABQ9ZIN4_9CRUS|nr:hypothetical protein OUZ56_025034 [Daphnia magna]
MSSRGQFLEAEEDTRHRGSPQENEIVAKDPEEGPSTTEEDDRDIEDRRGTTRSSPRILSTTEEDHRDIEDRRGSNEIVAKDPEEGPSTTEEDHRDIEDRRGSNKIVAKDPEEGPSTTEEDHRDIEDRRGSNEIVAKDPEEGPSTTEEDDRDIEDRRGTTRSSPRILRRAPAPPKRTTGTSRIAVGQRDRGPQHHRRGRPGHRGSPWDNEIVAKDPEEGPSTTEEDDRDIEDRRGTTRSSPRILRRAPAPPKRTTGTSRIAVGATRSSPRILRRAPAPPKRTTEEDHQDIEDRRGSNKIVAKDPEEGPSTTEEDDRDIEDRRGTTRSSPRILRRAPAPPKRTTGTSRIAVGATRSSPRILRGPQHHRRGRPGHRGSPWDNEIVAKDPEEGPSTTEEDDRDIEDRRGSNEIVEVAVGPLGHRGSPWEQRDRRGRRGTTGTSRFAAQPRDSRP